VNYGRGGTWKRNCDGHFEILSQDIGTQSRFETSTTQMRIRCLASVLTHTTDCENPVQKFTVIILG